MRSPDNRQSEAQARHAAVIVEQVLAISGEGLADEVEIQVPADQTIDRIGYVGIDRALARPEIEPGIGRDSQPVALADLGKQAYIDAIGIDVRIFAEAAGLTPERAEEHCVGEEWVRTRKYRWAKNH